MFAQNVAIPSSVRIIRDNAFQQCKGFEEIVVPEGVEEIGMEAYAYCGYLRTITLPSTLKRIYSDVFKGSTQLTKIRFNGSRESAPEFDFKSLGLNNPVEIEYLG